MKVSWKSDECPLYAVQARPTATKSRNVNLYLHLYFLKETKKMSRGLPGSDLASCLLGPFLFFK